MERTRKGKSLIAFPDDYIVIDLETTGLSCAKNEIIEISALKIKNDKIIDTFTTLVKPEKKVGRFISNLTGITNEVLENAPKISCVMNDFLNFVQNNIVLGHNVNFDVNFIHANSLKILDKEFNNNFVDTLRLSRKYCEIENHKLQTVAKYFKINTQGHHRALNDCKITYEIFKAIKSKVLCCNEK